MYICVTKQNKMTQSEAVEKLNALTKSEMGAYRIAKNSLAYATALEAIQNPGKWIVCGANTGSGRFSGSKSWQSETFIILENRLGLNARIDNVAPKGGKAGDRIMLNYTF